MSTTPRPALDADGETPLARTRRARRVHRLLAERYPDAHCELDFTTPFQLLVATVLSAQCTDARVNTVTPELFARWPEPVDLAGAERAELEAVVQPTGFFRAKADALLRLSATLVAEHGGRVPPRLEDLVRLPGVGRKTANVVLGDAFGVPGLTVDTHVGRLSRRLGFTRHEDPVKVEADLAQLIERRGWTMFNHRMIFHGRRTCHSRKPACGACAVARLCPSYGTGETDPVRAAKLVRGPVPPAGPAAPAGPAGAAPASPVAP
ncbi:endonuclease III [Kineococcus sp. SYSU DK005]|uniref:endonuclease III n=1 Tax=Kineococcus sp. SYSU DK005 TaxID=3383126 RepID=UPI003D7DC7DA